MARSVKDRIEWFRTHKPAAVGLCLRHTWQATDIPAVGKPDANSALSYVREHGHLNADRNPPRGAWVFWSSSTHGHAALSLGKRRILSTDVAGPATTGAVPLTYPETHWNHRYEGWSSWYGVEFPVRNSLRRRLRKRRSALRARLRAIAAKLRKL